MIPAATGRVRQLQAMPAGPFRRLVAQDVQREPAVGELTHPLLLARWDQALRELAELTTEALGIPLRSHAAVADADLTLAGLPELDAGQRINQFRFLVHVRQRWLEQSTRERRLRRQLGPWRDAMVVTARLAARERLRHAHAGEYADLLANPPAAPDTAARIPAPRTSSTPGSARSVPQALLAFRDRIQELGWETSLDQNGTDRARVQAVLGRTATIHLTFRHKNKGRGAGAGGWTRTYLAILIPGLPGWTPLATIADALDLATHPADELPEHVRRYQQQHPPRSPRPARPLDRTDPVRGRR